VRGSIATGLVMSRLTAHAAQPSRWETQLQSEPSQDLVQITGD